MRRHSALEERIGSAERLLREACGERMRTRFPLAPLTSFRIGGPAALFLEAESEGDLVAAAEAVRRFELPWAVIGKGSNVLVADRGFEGLVIRLGKGFRWAGREGLRLRSGASMPLPALAGVALTHRLAGLEFGVAIPGSLGGAVRMNAGAHGASMEKVLESLDLFQVPAGRWATLPAHEAGLGYRQSRLPAGSIVTSATLSLREGRAEEIRSRMEEARAWRRATQPVAEPNCGSVFKNPPGRHAAWLVEEAGAKGLSVGRACVSEKHANFIVAAPGTSAQDVCRLMEAVRARVEERFGIRLAPEVQLVGDFGPQPS